MRRPTWILWLMLALLPLRGWAVAGMAMPEPVRAAVMAHQAAASVGDAVDAMNDAAHHTPDTSALRPCHSTPGAQDNSGDSTPVGSACTACDVCHAAWGLAPSVAVVLTPPPTCAPAVMAQRDTGRAAVSGLDRPPRSLRA